MQQPPNGTLLKTNQLPKFIFCSCFVKLNTFLFLYKSKIFKEHHSYIVCGICNNILHPSKQIDASTVVFSKWILKGTVPMAASYLPLIESIRHSPCTSPFDRSVEMSHQSAWRLAIIYILSFSYHSPNVIAIWSQSLDFGTSCQCITLCKRECCPKTGCILVSLFVHYLFPGYSLV